MVLAHHIADASLLGIGKDAPTLSSVRVSRCPIRIFDKPLVPPAKRRDRNIVRGQSTVIAALRVLKILENKRPLLNVFKDLQW
jgi:hypothetical protein